MHTDKVNGIHFRSGTWPLATNRPTLIFIHGSGESAALWEHQVKALADVANTVAVDLPGHGRSDPPAMDRVEAYARALAGFIDTIGAPGPIPCGLSIGGAIVQQLLLDFPQKFQAGILVSTGARLRVLPALLEMVAADFPGFLDMLAAISASPKTDPGRWAPIHAVTANCPPEIVLGDFKACDRFDVIDRLGEVGVPVLVISAEDDQLTPLKYGEFLEAGIAGARRVVIADAGHLVPVEQPEAVNTAIREFVAALGHGERNEQAED